MTQIHPTAVENFKNARSTVTFNADGQLASKTSVSNGAVTSYTYDGLGRLRTVQLPGNTRIDYVLDMQGRRIGKVVNGSLVQGWRYSDSLRPVAQLNSSGQVEATFVYETRANVPEFIVKSTGQVYRMVTDHLGSVRLVVNTADGSVAQRMDYDEFGVVVTDTNPGFQPFGFAGGLYDADTGLTRFGARDYDPVVGRWTAKDPILFDGGQANLFGYVSNDPINGIDPSGRSRSSVGGACACFACQATAMAASGACGALTGPLSPGCIAVFLETRAACGFVCKDVALDIYDWLKKVIQKMNKDTGDRSGDGSGGMCTNPADPGAEQCE